MAINYSTDIIPFFATDVVNQAEYQAGGTYNLPPFFGALTLSAVAIGTAGTGYSTNDVVTLSGGTLYSGGAAATVKIVSVNAGVPTGLSIVTKGDYSVAPTNPISTTGGAGSGLTITGTWTGYAQQRILTMIEIVKAYFNEMDNTHEAKLFHEILGRILASMSFGSTSWDQNTMSLDAQKDALHFLAGHVLAADI
jgi:hypothetical protein